MWVRTPLERPDPKHPTEGHHLKSTTGGMGPKGPQQLCPQGATSKIMLKKQVKRKQQVKTAVN